jgi:putative ATP-dependent endonuclease of OLD family
LLLQKISIKGFKSLKDVTLRFDSFSIIIGKNDIGKSSALRAINIFLNDSKPSIDEVSNGMNSVEITATFLLYNEELIDKKLMELVGSYLENNNDKNKKLTIKKVFAVDEKDNEENSKKIKNVEIFINEEKLKQATWKSILKYLPQYIYIESIRDISKETKMTSTSILGKLLLPLITKQNKVKKQIQELHSAIGTHIGTITKDIESFLQEQSPNVQQLIPKSNLSIDKAVDVELIVDDGYSKTSIEKKGSGLQSSLIVSLFRAYAKYHIERNIIFGIEEPDSFLHVSAQRQIFHAMQSLTKSDGQVIITTHSPIFINRGDLKGITLLKRDEHNEVVAKRIKKEKHILQIQEDLGIRNSDLFQWDAILMVEGGTDATVINIWAQKLGINLDSLGIKIIVMEGKSKASVFANAKILVDLGIPYSILLDSDEQTPEENINDLIKKNNLNKENFIILQRREIENYYPVDAIKQAFPDIDFNSVIFGDDVDVKKQLEIITGKKAMAIGRKVAALMEIGQIPNEVKETLNYLTNKITSKKQPSPIPFLEVAATQE